MSDGTLYDRIIGEKPHVWTYPLRGVLLLASYAYRYVVCARNRRYDLAGPSYTPPVPVISVGNITVGGTGKTPMVIDLVHRLERMGRNPAVVSRGYRAPAGKPNDEELLIRKHCPGVVYAADPDRISAVRRVCGKIGADAIVLDDAFQHRRLGRTLDMVLVDATCPFGYGHVFPRGLLREPLKGLRRAGVIVLTRCEQAPAGTVAQTMDRLHTLAPDATLLKCNHCVAGVETLDGESIEGELAGRRVVLFASVGNPKSFDTTARMLGVNVVGCRWWPDHHAHRARDVERLRRAMKPTDRCALLTTEKDAVKLARLDDLDRRDILVVRIAIDFDGDDGTILDQVLEQALREGTADDETLQPD